MKNQFRKIAIVLSIFTASFSLVSCDDDDAPQAEKVEETITQVKLTFTGSGTSSGLSTVEAIAKDDNGDGQGFEFNLDPIELDTNATYNLSVSFLNELETPAEDVTEEIKVEADEHQIFFTQTGGVFTTIDYTDEEKDYFATGCTGCENSDKPVGLKNTVTTGATVGATGTLRVQLKHQPDGQKTGSADSGEDDVNLTFNVKLK